MRRGSPWSPCRGWSSGVEFSGSTDRSRKRGRDPILANPSSSLDRAGQAEPCEHAVVEARHGTDPVAAEGQDVQTDSVAYASRGAQIGSECRLTVGSSRHEGKPPACAKEAGAEADHDIAALVFEWHWWHRDEDILR